MKILLIIHEHLDPNSGAAGSTWKLGQEYQKFGHKVTHYSFDDLPQKMSPILKEVFFPIFVAIHISKMLKEQKVDIVDASTGDAWLWAKVFRKFNRKIPILVTRSHGLEHMMHLANKEDILQKNMSLSWKYPLYRGTLQLWQVKQSLLDANLVYLLNHQEKDFVVKKLKVKSKDAYVFPNGIPNSFLNLPFKSQANAEEEIIQIAVVSTFIPRKGINYSVPALNNILKLHPQVKISFLGTECRECSSTEQVYARFYPTVRDRIKVFPRFQHEELPQLLEGHQIKLLASVSEGFGKALIEAMACGLVPVATSTPGPLDILTNGYDGIIVPPRNSIAIEQALKKLIDDRIFLEQLRRNAYNTAQKYSWSEIAKNRLSIYSQGLYDSESNQVRQVV